MAAGKRATWVGLALLLAGAGWAADGPTVPGNGPPAPPAGAGATSGGAAEYFSGRLVDDAQRRLRSSTVAPVAAAHQAIILLQYASLLDPNDSHAVKLLAEAARAVGDTTLQKDTLRKLISLDRSDLVAQVKYLELLASGKQALEERAQVYQSALDQSGLNPQIRSEMAVRLADIAQERGDTELEKRFFDRAIALNDVNINALRGLVRLSAQNPREVPRHLATLVTLLTADPYQPDAWLEMSRICGAANLHDRAADYLTTAMDQMQMQGIPPAGDAYLVLATELATAGRRAEAYGIVSKLANLPDAPLAALVIAEMLASTDVTGSAAAIAAMQPQKEVLAQKIRAILAAELKASPARADTLADSAGIELTVLPTVSPDVAGSIEQYAKLVAPEDTTLARLRGWQAYRDGKLDAAREILSKTAAADPLAQIGLARVLMDQGKKDEAAKQLQELWSGHPAGLLALQVTEAARRAGITLADTMWTKELRDAAARMPATVAAAYQQPREIELIDVHVRKAVVGIGEPLWLTIRMSNVTTRPLPVGPQAMVGTIVGLTADTEGNHGEPLGLYAIEDVQRQYRLESHAMMECILRIDQGQLGDLLEKNPVKSLGVEITAYIAPRVGGVANKDVVPGLGGQKVSAGDVQRAGLPIGTPAEFARLLDEVKGGGAAQGAGIGTQKQLVRISVAGTLLGSLLGGASGGKSTPPEGEALRSQEAAKHSLVEALTPQAGADDHLVRAAMARSLPAENFGGTLDRAMDAMSTDSDPLVRVMWAARETRWAARGPEMGRAALGRLQARATDEKDPMVKEWMGLMIEEMQTPPAAAAPATQHAPSP